MTRETEEAIANLANAFVIVVGTLIVELDRADAIDRSAFTQLLRRKAFDAAETGAEPDRADLLYMRLIADAVDNEPR